jgi:hypothetical protein
MIHKIIFGVAISFTILSVAKAAPLFYLSQAADAASATAGLLNKWQLPGPGATGVVNIFADSDVRLSGVSLNVIATGNAIKLTGPVTVPNPATRWFALDAPQTITDGKILHIGGAAINGLSGEGIGGNSPQGARVLLASFGFQVLGGGVSNLLLQVGDNGIADCDTGAFPTVFFGTQSGTGISGNPNPTPGSGIVGTINGCLGCIPPDLQDELIDTVDANNPGMIFHNFLTNGGQLPGYSLQFDSYVPAPGITGTGPTTPAYIDTPTGRFAWNTIGSPIGTYKWLVTGTIISALTRPR